MQSPHIFVVTKLKPRYDLGHPLSERFHTPSSISSSQEGTHMAEEEAGGLILWSTNTNTRDYTTLYTRYTT